ncbi:MAG: Hsp70 family protein [Pseudomonadota bacterium]
MEKVLGLDVGAWGATAAVIVDGEPRLYPSRSAGARLPGMVSLDHKGAVFVAETARRRAVLDPPSTVITPMRLLGRFPGDIAVRRTLAHTPCPVVPGPAGHATLHLAGTAYAVPEIVAQLIQHLRTLAEQDLGEPVTKTVLTVPACFGDAHRQSMVLAARLAGLETMRILSSPLAATVAQTADGGQDMRWLVVDAGGSQIGAAVVDRRGKLIECLSLACDASIGALDVDTALCESLIEEFKHTVGYELSANLTARTRLIFATEHAKRSLADHEQVRIRLREFVAMAGESIDFDSYLDRGNMDRLAQPFFEAVLAAADEALARADLQPAAIQGLLLVGGGCRLSNVRQDLSAFAGRDTPVEMAAPEAPAVGAAMYGEALVSNPAMAVEDIRLLGLDVASADVVIATSGGYSEVIIPAGAHLPLVAHRVFTTSQDNQTQVRILISQTPRGVHASHGRLGEFVLDGLRPGQRGAVRINVGFELDRDGILHVSARDLVTGHRTASDVRISLSVAEQALAAVREARDLSEDTLRTAQQSAVRRRQEGTRQS